MNMNILINRQDEEADECWPVTFVLPNISTEGEPCPGSVNTTEFLEKPEEASLFSSFATRLRTPQHDVLVFYFFLPQK